MRSYSFMAMDDCRHMPPHHFCEEKIRHFVMKHFSLCSLRILRRAFHISLFPPYDLLRCTASKQESCELRKPAVGRISAGSLNKCVELFPDQASTNQPPSPRFNPVRLFPLVLHNRPIICFPTKNAFLYLCRPTQKLERRASSLWMRLRFGKTQ